MAGGGARRRRIQGEEHSTSDEDSDITDVRFMCTWVVYYWQSFAKFLCRIYDFYNISIKMFSTFQDEELEDMEENLERMLVLQQRKRELGRYTTLDA